MHWRNKMKYERKNSDKRRIDRLVDTYFSEKIRTVTRSFPEETVNAAFGAYAPRDVTLFSHERPLKRFLTASGCLVSAAAIVLALMTARPGTLGMMAGEAMQVYELDRKVSKNLDAGLSFLHEAVKTRLHKGENT